MKKEFLEYYLWSDIKKEICQRMKIDKKDFRNYHNIVGGEYKDLWYEWIKYFDIPINDTINPVDLGEHFKSKLEWIKKDNELPIS